MIRPIHSLALLAALGGAALTGTGGCVDNDADAPMRIIANIAPGSGCSVDSGSNVFIDDGFIDASLPGGGYVFTPAVVNELTTVEGEAVGPKTIYIEGADVDIAFYDTTSFPAASFAERDLHFFTGTSGSIEPNGGTGAYSFEIVPRSLLDAMLPILEASDTGVTTLDVRIQMKGLRGGNSVHSQSFRYPVQVCINCGRVDQGTCASLPEGFIPRNGGACQKYQDGVVDCCDNFLVCPARAPDGV